MHCHVYVQICTLLHVSAYNKIHLEKMHYYLYSKCIKDFEQDVYTQNQSLHTSWKRVKGFVL